MFRITEDPSSGSLVQCLAKNFKNVSIVSVDMDKALPSYTVNYTHTHTHTQTHNGSEYAAITPTFSMSTDTIESFL